MKYLFKISILLVQNVNKIYSEKPNYVCLFHNLKLRVVNKTSGGYWYSELAHPDY